MTRACSRTETETTIIRMLIALIPIVYLVGVGVVLSPTIQSGWNSDTASSLFASIGQALPSALVWPVRLYHGLTDHG